MRAKRWRLLPSMRKTLTKVPIASGVWGWGGVRDIKTQLFMANREGAGREGLRHSLVSRNMNWGIKHGCFRGCCITHKSPGQLQAAGVPVQALVWLSDNFLQGRGLKCLSLLVNPRSTKEQMGPFHEGLLQAITTTLIQDGKSHVLPRGRSYPTPSRQSSAPCHFGTQVMELSCPSNLNRGK